MKLLLTVLIFGLVYIQSVLSAKLACGGTSAAKTITLENPATTPTSCTYKINPYCTKICQLRVVMEEFNFAPPTTTGNGHPMCQDDIFSVKNIQLCGVNNNQHFYVTSTHAKAVQFSLKLDNRTANPTLPAPKWKITITQLECPTGILGRSLLGDDIFDETVADETNGLIAQQRAVSTTADAYYLAPIGCLQYFPTASGTIESFNFNNAVGPYYKNFNYAICFGRGENDTFVRLTIEYFKMGVGYPGAEGYDGDCYGMVEMDTRHEDYLFLPFAKLSNGRRGTQFCGDSLNAADYVDIRPPGPFVINVASNEHYNSTTDIGFKFNYQIL